MVREKFKVGAESWTNIEYSWNNQLILISTNGDYLKILSSQDLQPIGSDLTGHLPTNYSNGPTRGAFVDGLN